MNTKDLIEDLSKNVSVVKPMPETRIRFWQVLGAMLGGVALTFLLFSVRHDLHQVIDQKQFLLGAAALLLGWMSAAYSLSLLQVPTYGRPKYLYFGLALVASLSLGYLISGTVFSDSEKIREGLNAGGIKCSLDILFLAIIPTLLTFFLVGKGAPTEISLAGFNVGLCSALVGAFALQFSCPSTLPFHLLVWHILIPLGVLAYLGGFISLRVLRW